MIPPPTPATSFLCLLSSGPLLHLAPRPVHSASSSRLPDCSRSARLPFLARCAPSRAPRSVRLRSAAAGAGPPKLEELRGCGGRRAGSRLRDGHRVGLGRWLHSRAGRTPARGGATMGCSSSALGKAGDRSRLRSEESESGFVQPKPLTLGREATIYDKVQNESLPPPEKLKISAMSTANGVKSLHEQPLAKDAADPPGSTERPRPLEGPRESGLLQPGGTRDTQKAEEKKDVEMVTGAQPSEGSAETEPLAGEAQSQPLGTAGARAPPGVVGDTEIPLTARETKPLRTAEEMPPLEAGREPQPQEAMGKPPLLDTVPKETEAPEILEGSQLVETAEEHEVRERLGRDEQSQLLKTMPRERGFLKIPEGSQLVKTAVKNDLIHRTPERPENMEQIQPEGVVGSMERPAGMLEAGTDTETVRKTHPNEEDHHIEGETGEKVETEKETVSEGAETQEEETGEAVDLSAAA